MDFGNIESCAQPESRNNLKAADLEAAGDHVQHVLVTLPLIVAALLHRLRVTYGHSTQLKERPPPGPAAQKSVFHSKTLYMAIGSDVKVVEHKLSVSMCCLFSWLVPLQVPTNDLLG